MTKELAAWSLLVASLALTAGCSGVSREGSMPVDAGERDATADESSSEPATTDDEPDAGPDETPLDGAVALDSSVAAPLDAAIAAPPDATLAAPLDSTVAAPPDSSTSDAAPVDASRDDANADPAGHADAGDGAVLEACATTQRTLHTAAPDVMIVLDRSGSLRPPTIDCRMPDVVSAFTVCLAVDCNDPMQAMGPSCGGTMVVDHWAPAVTAIKALTQMFADKLSFGLTTFPGEGASTQAGQQNGCTPGSLRVAAGLNTAGTIADALDMTTLDGFTPISSTLEAVLQQIQQKRVAPNAEVPPQFVLLVTDGAPNCVGGNSGMEAQAHMATVAAIDALATAGVKTFVMGYDASVDPNLARQLTEYAQHGGTDHLYALESGTSLPQGLGEVMSTVAECTYVLEGPAPAPAHVRVELDGKVLQADQPNGFSLLDKTLMITGSACLTLRDPNNTSVPSVTITCGP
jgi:von Willebrand factor type A domain